MMGWRRKLGRTLSHSLLPGCQRGFQAGKVAGPEAWNPKRRPGGCWVGGVAKDLGDWGVGFKAGELLRKEGMVFPFLLLQMFPPPPPSSPLHEL